jgi:hypothetical protein
MATPITAPNLPRRLVDGAAHGVVLRRAARSRARRRATAARGRPRTAQEETGSQCVTYAASCRDEQNHRPAAA